MNKIYDFNENEREEFDRRLENGFEFVQEIFDDPAILDRIPSGSNVESVPKADRDPNVHYDIETPRMLAIVTPPAPDRLESAPRPNGRTRRIDRNDTARLRRIRAAHR